MRTPTALLLALLSCFNPGSGIRIPTNIFDTWDLGTYRRIGNNRKRFAKTKKCRLIVKRSRRKNRK